MAPRLPRTPTYYTRRGQAQRAVPVDVPGAGVRFATGKGYYVGSRPSAHPAAGAAAANPFALLTPAQIQQQVAARTGGLPPVLTEAQLAARAQGQVDPLIAAISSRINARAQAGAGAISGYTKQLASELGKYQGSAANIYGQAQQAEAGTDAALSQMLSGQGNDLAANLASKLGAAGMPQTLIDKTTGEAKAVGTGSAGALYGTGSASLGDLISRGASAQDYAAKLPGIAGLGGLQSMRALEQQSQSELADQTAQVQEQIPTILANLRAGNEQAQSDRVTTANSIWDSLMGRNERIATGNRSRADTLALNRQRRADTLAANKQARADALNLGAGRNATAIQVAKARAAGTAAAAAARGRTAISVAKLKAGQQAAEDAKPNASLSRAAGYLVDSNGNYIPDTKGNPRVLPGFKVQGGQIVKVTPGRAGGGGAKGLTAGQQASLKKEAASAMDDYYYGSAPKQRYVTVTNPDGTKTGKWIEVPGTGTAGLTYGKAIARIMAQYSMTKAEATALANNYYAPGEYGRPAPPAPKPHPDTGFRGVKI